MAGNRIVMKSSLVILIVTLITAFALVDVQAKDYRWVIGRGHPAVGPGGKLLHDWLPDEISKRVDAATGDKITWVKAWGGAIAKVGDELEAIEKGVLTITVIMPLFETSKLPLGTFSYQTPFSTKDVGLASKVAEDLWMNVPYMQKSLTQYNAKFLAMECYDSYQLLTTFPVKTIEDLKGKKIAGAGPNLQWISPVGAVPVQSNLTEGYTSLQTGVYQGWIAFTLASEGFKYQDVAKFQTNADFGAAPAVAIGMDLKVFNSLDPKAQKVILDVGREYSLKYVEATNGYLQTAIDNMKKAGVTFYDLPQEERVKWAKALPNIAKDFVSKYEAQGLPAKEVLKYWLDGLKKAGYKFPREWVID
ncbi:MAG: C4-dicarboxylate TRAP transporter substrate-binding protein [Pseudomonadota bacterium]